MLSEDILEQRRGTITASAAHRIMAGWDKPKPSGDYADELYQWIEKHGKPLVGDVKGVLSCDTSGKAINAAYAAYQYNQPSKALLTYAEELACDELFDDDPSVWNGEGSAHIENGNERELEGMIKLAEATGLDFAKTGDDQIHLSVEGLGSTPDGIVYDDLDLVETGAEIKCRSPLHHARQLLISDNESLKEYDFERYCQVQVQIFTAQASHWYSANYNPYAKSDAHKLHFCVINRDDAFIEILRQRAAVVYEHKASFLQRLQAIKRPALEKAA